MSANTILLLQSILIVLQMINAGLAGVTGLPGWVAMVFGAVVGGFQFYVNRLGNQLVPVPPPQQPPAGP